jgi:hypothetical protein
MGQVQWKTLKELGLSKSGYLPLLRLRPGERCERCVMLQEPVGVSLHYVPGIGKLPCDGPGCRNCELPRSDYFYAAVFAVHPYYPRAWNTYLLEMHEEACRSLLSVECRGQYIQLSRDKDATSHLKVFVLDQRADEEFLERHPAVDCYACLYHLWRRDPRRAN